MKKPARKKLKLHRETIRTLESEHLDGKVFGALSLICNPDACENAIWIVTWVSWGTTVATTVGTIGIAVHCEPE